MAKLFTFHPEFDVVSMCATHGRTDAIVFEANVDDSPLLCILNPSRIGRFARILLEKMQREKSRNRFAAAACQVTFHL